MERKGGRPLPIYDSPLAQRITPTGRHNLAANGRTKYTLHMRGLALCVVVAALTLYASYVPLLSASSRDSQSAQRIPLAAQGILRQCANLRAVSGPPANFRERERSDRFEPGTRPTLIKNATLWTGARNGSEIVYGDIFLDKGLVRGIGYIPELLYADRETYVVDAHGGWVTPGIGELFTPVCPHLTVI